MSSSAAYGQVKLLRDEELADPFLPWVSFASKLYTLAVDDGDTSARIAYDRALQRIANDHVIWVVAKDESS